MTDLETKAIVDALQINPQSHPHHSLVEGILYFKGRLVIPNDTQLRAKFLEEAHTTLTGGHGGFLKTLKRLGLSVHWRGLPKFRGFDVILVVVDRLSKYSHFIALSHPYSAKTVAGLFYQEIVRLHGIPWSIVSDRDTIFLSAFWQELFCLSQTRLNMSTAYHPQSDGQTEAEFSFNISFHSSANTTPFKLVYGRDPPPLCPYVKGETLVADLEEQLELRDAMLKILLAYELDLPLEFKVHPIFHVSLLRPTHGQQPSSPPAPLPLSANLELLLTPSKVLNHRWTPGGILKILIQWDNHPLEDASWEDYDLIAIQFPTF
ncbi:uncharacterized protein LOC129286074 [Prosopis cineraria]|uniref:uncharacterized protein LOC129286074 n=1 Tax=Prosopis cineraria TaxID=364024 RepID=UPI0024102B41|nr:uncharacterized protein LOC129286074 [Prosopis cineraria]